MDTGERVRTLAEVQAASLAWCKLVRRREMGLMGGSEVTFRVELEPIGLTPRSTGESEGDGGRRERSRLSARRWARV